MKIDPTAVRRHLAQHFPLWLGGVGLALLAVSGLAYASARGLRGECLRQTAELSDLSRTAARLKAMKEEEAREPWLNWQERESEFGVLLEKAANQAGVYKPRLVAIEPQQSRMLDRTLGERVITVRLQEVSLEELARFLVEIASRKGAPHQKELNLQRVRDKADRWNVQLKLSLLFRLTPTVRERSQVPRHTPSRAVRRDMVHISRCVSPDLLRLAGHGAKPVQAMMHVTPLRDAVVTSLGGYCVCLGRTSRQMQVFSSRSTLFPSQNRCSWTEPIHHNCPCSPSPDAG